MAQAPNFLQRMLASKLLGELVEYLPEPTRDAVVDLRDYVQQHGRLPKFEPLRSEPLQPGQTVQAVGVLMGDAPAGVALRMINVLKGHVTGAALRGVNIVVGELREGSVRGANLVLGDVHGGLIRGLNVLIGDVYGGELRSVNVLIGNVRGGDVKCQVLIGHVEGGKVVTKLLCGTVSGGDVQAERTMA
jgi:hypothetical protein